MTPSAVALAAALFAQAATSPPSPPAAPAPAQQPAATASADDTPICRFISNPGSRFGHKECHTASEWRQMSAAAGDSVSKMQQMGGMTGGPH